MNCHSSAPQTSVSFIYVYAPKSSGTFCHISRSTDPVRILHSRVLLLDILLMVLQFGIDPELLDAEPSAIQESDQDFFVVVTSMVPESCPEAVLDFDSEKDGKRLTSEGQLLDAILDPTQLHCIRPVFAVGESGVGKTCALQAIGRRQDVRSRFPGGVLYISLGSHATEHTLTQQIAEMVETAGGRERANRIRMSSLAHAIEDADSWFQEFTLFLIDDIWCRNDITKKTIGKLSNLAWNYGSMIVCTARGPDLASGTIVQFDPWNSDDYRCRQVLCKNSLLTEPNPQRHRDNFRKVLLSCEGLPIALSVVGGAVRLISAYFCWDDIDASWALFYNLWEQKGGASTTDRVLLLLNLLDSASGVSYKWRYEALSVLRGTQYVTIDVLKRLWEVTDGEAECTVSLFGKLSLITVLRTRKAGVKNLRVGYRGGLADAAVQLASKHNSTILGVAALLRSCGGPFAAAAITKKSPEGETALTSKCHLRSTLSSQVRDYWKLIKDENLLSNFCWLLERASMGSDVLWLLSRPEWTVSQIAYLGTYQVVSEIEGFLQFANSDIKSDSRSFENLMFLTNLKEAILCTSGYNSRASVTCFQLYGRLLSLAEYNENILNFLKEIEEVVPKPWLKPQIGILPSVKVSTELQVAGSVLCSQFLDDSVRVVQNQSGCLCVTDHYLHLDRQEEKVMGSFTAKSPQLHTNDTTCKDFKRQTIAPDEGQVTIAVLSADGTMIVLGHSDGKVVVWENKNGSWSSSFLLGHKNEITHVSINAEGTSIMTASDDATCRIWTGENNSWRCNVLEGFTENINCIDISGNWSLILSGTLSGTVRFWQKNGSWSFSDFEGHEVMVTSVCASYDGSSAATGAWDGTIRIWGKQEKSWGSLNFEGHSEKVVEIRANLDWSKVVSLSRDAKLCVWEMKDGLWRKNTLTGHDRVRYCNYGTNNNVPVVMGTDTMHVLLGLWGMSVAVWESEGSEWIKTDLELRGTPQHAAVSNDGEHLLTVLDDGKVVLHRIKSERLESEYCGDEVTALCVSGDGKQVLSGSHNGTLCVWREEDDSWKSIVLEKRKCPVTSVCQNLGGTYVVAGFRDGAVHKWRKESDGWNISVLQRVTGPVTFVCMSENGTHIVKRAKGRISQWIDEEGAWSKPICVQHCLANGYISETGKRIVLKCGQDIHKRLQKTCDKKWVLVDPESTRLDMVCCTTELKCHRQDGEWEDLHCAPQCHHLAIQHGCDNSRQAVEAEVEELVGYFSGLEHNCLRTSSGYVLRTLNYPYVSFLRCVKS